MKLSSGVTTGEEVAQAPTVKMTSVTPFEINVPDAAIKKLKDKLALSDLPDEVEFSNDWAYGTPREDILRLAKYWKDGYDWRANEAKLNDEMPQFKTTVNVDGFGDLDIHFVHKKSPRAGSIPLLFCHGCRLIPTNILQMRVHIDKLHIRARTFHGSRQDPPTLN